MIEVSDGVFRLSTEHTSYWFMRTPFEHLEHIYYGKRIQSQSPEALRLKRSSVLGSCIVYDDKDERYCLDTLPLEWSGTGRGDFRLPAAELKMPDGSFVSDFLYQSHQTVPGPVEMETLPTAYGTETDCETLILTLRDAALDVELKLYYTVYAGVDVITRRAVLLNRCQQPLTIRRLMSLSLDMENRDFSLVTFDGSWIKEAHRHDRKLQYGTFVNSSSTGASSNRHNPGFLLYSGCAGEEHGDVYGFNLIYSGGHYGAAELSPFDTVRVQLGIQPQCFEWTLACGERFEAPEAVMTFSHEGFNGMSRHFHDFINGHVVRGDWKGRERPVLLNDWEACFFDFTRGKLMRLARQAKRLGVELFVLDDGWFGARNDDHAGLGDYSVNRKKLPRGMKHFADEIRGLGMDFGLWFEPEMVNPDSDLYRAHPDWAVTTPGRKPCLGRNQLVLDLTNPLVRDYIVENVSRILDEADISYVKWDMNRHMSDMYSSTLKEQGRFGHAYMLGLYQVLERIFRPRPHILLESCSSGGNRFDLGMLCYSPQVWTSDDTDPVERLDIQQGVSYLYPLSAMGAHVSCAPHQQTLRMTPLSTRFNVASFGCLGYELDLKYLTPMERREVREQIAFYKAHRKTMQYGIFERHSTAKGNKRLWSCRAPNGSETVAGLFQTQCRAAEGPDVLPLTGLEEDASYHVETKPQRLFIGRFGALIKHVLPVELNPDGLLMRLANRLYAMADCVEQYDATGDLLMGGGVHLNNQFMGAGYRPDLRMLGDFGSSLYVVTRKAKDNRAL